MDVLIYVWFAIIAFCIVMYVILDGFTLGTGIVMPRLNDHERDLGMSVVLPNWDGNQTWLVLGAACLYGAFPLAFSIILPAFYLPLIAMLIALLFRGICFEFRLKAQDKKRWDQLFIISSIVVAFIQGMVLGAFVQGLDKTPDQAGYYFMWLSSFSIFTGLAVIAGYSLLGATRLILKTEGELRRKMQRQAKISAILVILFMAAISIWTPYLSAHTYNRWFNNIDVLYLAVFPLLAIFSFGLIWYSINIGDDRLPYWGTVIMFLTGFAGLGYGTLPYLVPFKYTIAECAAPFSTLSFTIVGAVIMLPVLLCYTGYSYYIFRGKVREKLHY